MNGYAVQSDMMELVDGGCMAPRGHFGAGAAMNGLSSNHSSNGGGGGCNMTNSGSANGWPVMDQQWSFSGAPVPAPMPTSTPSAPSATSGSGSGPNGSYSPQRSFVPPAAAQQQHFQQYQQQQHLQQPQQHLQQPMQSQQYAQQELEFQQQQQQQQQAQPQQQQQQQQQPQQPQQPSAASQSAPSQSRQQRPLSAGRPGGQGHFSRAGSAFAAATAAAAAAAAAANNDGSSTGGATASTTASGRQEATAAKERPGNRRLNGSRSGASLEGPSGSHRGPPGSRLSSLQPRRSGSAAGLHNNQSNSGGGGGSRHSSPTRPGPNERRQSPGRSARVSGGSGLGQRGSPGHGHEAEKSRRASPSPPPVRSAAAAAAAAQAPAAANSSSNNNSNSNNNNSTSNARNSSASNNSNAQAGSSSSSNPGNNGLPSNGDLDSGLGLPQQHSLSAQYLGAAQAPPVASAMGGGPAPRSTSGFYDSLDPALYHLDGNLQAPHVEGPVPSARASLPDALHRLAQALETNPHHDMNSAQGSALAAAVVAAMAVSTSCQSGSTGGSTPQGAAIPGLMPDGMGMEGSGSHGGLRMAPLPESGIAELEARVENLEGSLSSMVAGANGNHSQAGTGAGREGAGDAKASGQFSEGARVLGERVARLEHSLGELRATLTRRLEALDHEAAESRRHAEEAFAESKSLRLELAELMSRLESDPHPKYSPQQPALSYVPTQTPSSAATSAGAATLPTVSVPLTAATATATTPGGARMSLGGGGGAGGAPVGGGCCGGACGSMTATATATFPGTGGVLPPMVSPQPSHTAPPTPTPTPTVPLGAGQTVRPPPPLPQQAGRPNQNCPSHAQAFRNPGVVTQTRLQQNGVACP